VSVAGSPHDHCPGSDTGPIRWLFIALLAALCSEPPAFAQPSSEYFPSFQSAPGFDPASALGALTAAGADRNNAAPAFAGLAERVRVDPLLGQATTRIPIEVPPGRHVTPDLALTYASRSGNGLVGRGWDLRWPRVERSTKFGVPVNPDDPAHLYLPPQSAEFVLVLPSGTIELDHYLGTSGTIHRYGSQAEESFARAEFDTSSNRWFVTEKSGMRWIFGGGIGDGTSRLGPLVLLSSGTFGWGVSEIVDPNGNRIAFQYTPTASTGSA
jgi:hypothetical protein